MAYAQTSSDFRRSEGSGPLHAGGSQVLHSTSRSTSSEPLPLVPKYLSVTSLTKRRKLPKSTGNLHAYKAEDYSQLSWPLPKMFGQEKYGFSLLDVEVKRREASRDPRFVKDMAVMSKKLIRLHYDQQIIDHEWRKTYKALLDAEHREATCGEKASQKAKEMFKKELETIMKYLLTLQEQRDMYENSIKEVYDRCSQIRTTIKSEADLDELRQFMEAQTRAAKKPDDVFWRTKFDIKSHVKREY